MHVVNERVGNVCGAKSGGKLGLPNPLGEPRAGRQPAEVLLEIGAEARNLFVLNLREEWNQDRFVEAATNEFHLASLDQLFQASKILGPMLLNPGKKRPGIVEAEMNLGDAFQGAR